ERAVGLRRRCCGGFDKARSISDGRAIARADPAFSKSTNHTNTCSPSRTGSAGNVLGLDSVTSTAIVFAPTAALAAGSARWQAAQSASVAGASNEQIVAATRPSGRTFDPRGARAPSFAKPEAVHAGRNRSTLSESIIVAFAASRWAFHTGPP